MITVDENGTEAAAGSGMTGSALISGSAAPIMIINRPFLFWIHETATGAPLFLGAVTDPTS